MLEANAEPGGAVRTAEATAPGFHNDLFSAFYPMTAASPVIRGIDLESYGLRWRHAPRCSCTRGRTRPAAVLTRDLDATVASLDRTAPGDGASFRSSFAEWSRKHLRADGGAAPPVPAGARCRAVLLRRRGHGRRASWHACR